MLISLCFSTTIYEVLTFELNRVERTHRLRIERGWPQPFRATPPLFLDPNLITETKNRLKIILLAINLGILGTSALAGYFLAGKTLKPIEVTMEEQKKFVADASHELRTPLTALKTTMEVTLRDKKMSLVEAKKVLQDNLDEVNGLQSLSDKLLSLTRYQSNGQNLIFEDIDITEVIQNAHRKILPLVKEKEIELKIKVKSQKLWANEESLEEMLLIFLDNAVKYTPPKGRVTISTRPDKKYLLLEIKDTGIGIDKKDLSHIFDRFYRADQSRSKSKVAGFGLGLSLAKRIIEIHKGTVEVESVLGKGTTFTIKLPLKHSS